MAELAAALGGPGPLSTPVASPGADGRFPRELDYYRPQVVLERISTAVFGRDGRRLFANGVFADDANDLSDLWAAAGGGAWRDAVLLEWRDGSGVEMPVAVGRPRQAAGWLIPDLAKASLATEAASAVAVTAGAWRADGAVEEFGQACALSPAQTRLVGALVEHGGVREAANSLRISYGAARKELAEIMARVGVRKHTALISRVVDCAFGILPLEPRADEILEDIWGMNARQAALAIAVARGSSRAEAARLAGISPALAKKELQAVYLTTAVANAGALARKISEAISLSELVRATRGDISPPTAGRQPLGLTPRPDGSQIAFSDFGPRSGAPVLLVHTTFASRTAPGPLVEALRGAGYRPIAIDRPGFGLTDPAARDADQAEQAVRDVATVLDRLRIDRADVVARGGFPFLRRLWESGTGRIGRIVLVAVPPPGRIPAPAAAVYRLFHRVAVSQPHLIRDIAMAGARLMPLADVRQRVLDSVAGCAADTEALSDPRNFADYLLGMKAFFTGRIEGFVREQTTLGRLRHVPPVQESAAWTLVQGELDSMFDATETISFWRTVLPEGTITTLPDGGRFLVFTHPGAVVAALGGPATA